MRTLLAIIFLILFSTSTDGQDSLGSGGLSEKAKKLSGGGQNSITTTTPDPFFDFGFDTDDDATTTEDPFFDFGDGFDDFASFLPPCDSLFEVDRMPGENCDNSTVVEPEIRIPDPIYERLIAQVWSDFQYKLNTESQLYGQVLDPLDVDAKLPEPIDLHQVGAGFSADVQMHGIKMYGLSKINLDTVEVTRSENLTDFRMRVVFGFDHLEINGTYAMKGYVGWWALNSDGEQLFSIKMINATLAYEMTMDLVDPNDWTARRCSPTESLDTAESNVLIEEINVMLRYDDIDFKFNNLGSFANTVVNGVGIFFLQTQEETLVNEIRKAIKKNINSLIC